MTAKSNGSIRIFLKSKDMLLKTILKYILCIKKYISVEPVIFCYLFPTSLANIALQNLYLEKACRVNKNYGDAICTSLMEHLNITNSSNVEIEVQRLVTIKNSWTLPLQMGIPAITMLFVGAWSDKHAKRKLIMLMPFLGQLIYYSGMILSTYFIWWPVEVVGVLESLPSALAGGPYYVFLAAFSYIADNFEPEKRTLHFGIIYIVISMTSPIGNILSGIFLQVFGFYGVFSICIGILICGFMYGYMAINDKIIEEKNDEDSSFCVKYFNGEMICNTFLVVLKKRNQNRRLRIILIIVCSVLLNGPTFGKLPLLYMYTRRKFDFDELNYSLNISYAGFINVLGLLVATTVFGELLKTNGYIFAIIASTSRLIASIIFAFAPTALWFYLGSIVELFGGTGSITLRSMATKIVDLDEIGKINSILGVSDALNLVIYPPILNEIYINTIETFPGAFFIFSGFIFLLCIGLFWYLHKLDVIFESKFVDKEDLKKSAIQVE